MGDSLVRYFDKEMPSILVHKQYNDPTDCDTTEKIVTLKIFNNVTDIFIYSSKIRAARKGRTGIQVGSDSLALTELISFNYNGNSIESALLKVLKNGIMVEDIKEEYSFLDSLKMIKTSLIKTPGSSLKLAFRDDYYQQENTKKEQHSNYSLVDLGNGLNDWHEEYREVKFYDTAKNAYNNAIKFLISTADTTWSTTEYSLDMDSSVTTITQKVGSHPQLVMERITKTFDNDNKITSIVSEIRQNKDCSLKYYSSEEFEYFDNDSIIYKRSFYDTLSNSFKFATQENHLFHSDGRYRNILYFEQNSNDLNLVGEDIFTYASTTTEVNKLKRSLYTSSIRKVVVPGKIHLTIDNSKSNLSGMLYTISGKKVRSFSSKTVSNSELFEIKTNSLASGKYLFICLNQNTRLTIPLIIEK